MFGPQGGWSLDTAALNEKLHNLLLDRNQPTFAATTAGAPGGMAFSPSSSRPSTRPPSPSFGARLPSRPSSPAYSHSSSRTRFTGTLELPLLTAPGSTAHPPAVDQQHKLLLARIVELERAYQELARAYERAEREKEYWKGLATGGNMARSASPAPHTYSPSASLPSSRAPSRPASPAHAAYPVPHFPPNPHPSSLLPPRQQQLPSSMRRGHAHSQSWTGLTSLR
ncbi:hypothetical protein JCM8097_004654 [Rhodosporidiobolus ruineniae]